MFFFDRLQGSPAVLIAVMSLVALLVQCYTQRQLLLIFYTKTACYCLIVCACAFMLTLARYVDMIMYLFWFALFVYLSMPAHA